MKKRRWKVGQECFTLGFSEDPYWRYARIFAIFPVTSTWPYRVELLEGPDAHNLVYRSRPAWRTLEEHVMVCLTL